MALRRSSLCVSLGLALAAGAIAAPAMAQTWDWHGGGRDDARAYALVGPGVQMLIPELRDTRRGQAFVLRNFDYGHDGVITPREAHDANRAFLDVAGPDRSRFDWDRYGRSDQAYNAPEPPRAYDPPQPRQYEPQPPPPREYSDNDYRQPMRDYHFRQNQYGAMFTLQDVLFQTGSAQLREGAEARLLPLAHYLKLNPRVQLRIDGYTDSVGSAASNVELSRNRARSVADILAAAGVESSRFQLDGHGETSPVASNATPEGRQLNRRVEVTLVGQQASTFE